MKTYSGFTLIEVLIAMLLLAGGLLGLAALQTVTIRNNLSAYHRGQGVQLLYDMSDRIRSNNCKSSSTVTCSANLASYVIANSNTLGATATPNCKTSTTSCNPTQLSNYDLIEWNNAITGTLPMGRACITSTNGIFTLYITWDDDRSGTVITNNAVPTGCAAGFSTYTAGTANADPVFTMSVQP